MMLWRKYNDFHLEKLGSRQAPSGACRSQEEEEEEEEESQESEYE